MSKLSYKTACEFGSSLFDLYIKDSKDANTAISPISVFVCMSMLKHGAGGQTKAELEKALCIDAGSDGKEAENIIGSLKKSADQKFTLTTANGLFLQLCFEPVPDFVQLLKSKFNAHVQTVEFGCKQGEKIVNDWVEKQTNGKIKDLVQNTTPDTVLALINAVYLKGKWLRPFKPAKTDELDFDVSKEKKVKAKFMRQEARFDYVENKEELFAMAFLPYESESKNSAWEMGILLPEKGSNPADFLKFLQHDSLKSLRSKANEQLLDLMLPKCKIESSIDLIPILKTLGVKEAFTMGANFSGISGNEATMVSAILQKCFVDIDEEGTEAAAATVVMMMRCAMMRTEEPTRFHVTSPYVYFMHQPSTGIVLFSGVVHDPSA